jgi:hypothetical protein
MEYDVRFRKEHPWPWPIREIFSFNLKEQNTLDNKKKLLENVIFI